LAQSYKDAEEPELALEHYKKRFNMGGWVEEMYFSLLMIGKLSIQLEKPFEEISEALMKAYDIMPNRNESIYYLVNYCRRNKMYHLGYNIGKLGVHIRSTNAVLFVYQWIYDYAMLDDYAVCAYWAQDFKECKRCCEMLLEEKKIPEHYIQRIKDNIRYSEANMK
jgi:hypothetical protein